MEITVLASGSKGNCVYIEGEDGALLVGVGRSGRELLGTKAKPGLLAESGRSAENIDGILVTHEHVDHIRGLAAVGKSLNKPVYGTVGTIDAFLRQRTSPVLFPVHTVKCGSKYKVGSFRVEPFAISHDSTEPCGYLISEGSTRICYCTDTGLVTGNMMSVISQADGVILESNHCPDMLRTGRYPEFLKRRIAGSRGHLSNPDAAAVLHELGDSIHLAILAHLSEENNEPGLALSTAMEGLSLHAESVELFAASTVDLKEKASVRKMQGSARETCTDECWRYRFSL
jgi:phosphoribosyl 1,2-cyclic phosphodiesterase